MTALSVVVTVCGRRPGGDPPAASMLLVAGFLGGRTAVAKTFGTDYRGPVAIFASPRINDREMQKARWPG